MPLHGISYLSLPLPPPPPLSPSTPAYMYLHVPAVPPFSLPPYVRYDNVYVGP